MWTWRRYLIHQCRLICQQILDVEDTRNKEIIELIVSMSDIVDYVVDVEQFATVAQLKAVIGEANDLMRKTVEFFNKHKGRGTLCKHSSTQLVYLSLSECDCSGNVFTAFSPSAKEELVGLQDAFCRFKEKFDRGMSVQTTISVSNLESQLRALGECFYRLRTSVEMYPLSPSQ